MNDAGEFKIAHQMTLQWANYPGLSRRAHREPQGVRQVKGGQRVSLRGTQCTEGYVDLLALNTEGATGQGIRRPLEAGKGRGMDSSLEALGAGGEQSPANTLVLAQWHSFQASDLWNRKTIKLLF